MPSQITFPAGHSYEADRDGIAFPAALDGRPVTCFITAEALAQHFGARDHSRAEAEAAFARHRPGIETIVRGLIEQGQEGPPGEVLITVNDVH